MVERFFKLFHREVIGLHEAAALLGLSALVSQLLALVRDRLLAVTFGAGPELDIYYSAFRLPDLLYVSIASFLSVSVLLPMLEHKRKDSLLAARQFLSQILTFFVIVMVIVSIIALVIMPWIAPVVAPGFSGEARSELVLLARVLLFSPLLLGLSNLFAAVTQSLRRFFVYALSPLLYNLGIIAGFLWFYPRLGLVGLAWGVVLGASLHLAIQLPVAHRAKLLPGFHFGIAWGEMAEVLKTSLPRSLGLASSQLALWVLTALATLVGAGSVAVFTLAQNLQSVPLVIIGVSYSVAAFPTLATLFVNGERDKFLLQMTTALRHIVFWSVPMAVLFIVLRAQIVRVILGAGRFDWNDTRLVAASLALFMLSVVAQGLVLLFVRAYYAASRTRTPLVINLAATLLAISAAAGLYFLLGRSPASLLWLERILRVEGLGGTVVLGLPLAFSLGMLFNLVLFWFKFQKDFGRFSRVVDRSVWQSIAGSLSAGAAAYFALDLLDDFLDLDTFIGIFTQGLIAGTLGLVVFFGLLSWWRNKEITEVARTLHQQFWRAKPIAPEPSGVENP